MFYRYLHYKGRSYTKYEGIILCKYANIVNDISFNYDGRVKDNKVRCSAFNQVRRCDIDKGLECCDPRICPRWKTTWLIRLKYHLGIGCHIQK